MSARGRILKEAEKIVYGRGEDEYGHPRDNFTQTAQIWTALLRGKLLPGAEIDAEDVARLQVGLKLSRDTNKPLRDNAVDMAGYAATLDRVRNEDA